MGYLYYIALLLGTSLCCLVLLCMLLGSSMLASVSPCQKEDTGTCIGLSELSSFTLCSLNDVCGTFGNGMFMDKGWRNKTCFTMGEGTLE